ncbi:hypothetical protein V865_007805 [Kwoniella europaea PYCC6329]|uniref:Uncharacterized protein n=1 Tax=Kwoniella europaea PYCC6329 TaxID=1423913 RepID=A0AAX4KTC9_9TREE
MASEPSKISATELTEASSFPDTISAAVQEALDAIERFKCESERFQGSINGARSHLSTSELEKYATELRKVERKSYFT